MQSENPHSDAPVYLGLKKGLFSGVLQMQTASIERLQLFTDPEELRRAISMQRPAAVLVSADFRGAATPDGATFLQELRASYDGQRVLLLTRGKDRKRRAQYEALDVGEVVGFGDDTAQLQELLQGIVDLPDFEGRAGEDDMSQEPRIQGGEPIEPGPLPDNPFERSSGHSRVQRLVAALALAAMLLWVLFMVLQYTGGLR